MLKDSFDFLRIPADIMLFSVVSISVTPNKSHIVNKILSLFVDIVVQFLLDGSQIHRLGNDVKVVHDVELHWVDGLVEPESALEFPAIGEEFLGELLPGS